jgi:hypothetical protein
MNGMFQNCLKCEPNVLHWDVSKVTDFSDMFSGARRARPMTAYWDTSSAQNMHGMFECSEYDGGHYKEMTQESCIADPIVSGWDVSKVG